MNKMRKLINTVTIWSRFSASVSLLRCTFAAANACSGGDANQRIAEKRKERKAQPCPEIRWQWWREAQPPFPTMETMECMFIYEALWILVLLMHKHTVLFRYFLFFFYFAQFHPTTWYILDEFPVTYYFRLMSKVPFILGGGGGEPGHVSSLCRFQGSSNPLVEKQRTEGQQRDEPCYRFSSNEDRPYTLLACLDPG